MTADFGFQPTDCRKAFGNHHHHFERLCLEEKKLTEEKDARQNQLDDRIRKLAMEHRLN